MNLQFYVNNSSELSYFDCLPEKEEFSSVLAGKTGHLLA